MGLGVRRGDGEGQWGPHMAVIPAKAGIPVRGVGCLYPAAGAYGFPPSRE